MEDRMNFYRFLSEYIHKFHPNIYEKAVKDAAIRQGKNEAPLFSTAPPFPLMDENAKGYIEDDIDDFISSWGLK